jgi:NADPH-dependent glutamate synthase beta subunit-like oxidoreductase/CO/xanthine dehydrogenase FAD-binding subunit
MKTFKHYNARTLKHAVSLLSKHGGKAVFNAGGTDLLGSLRDRCISDYPEALVNIKTIPGLDYIKASGRGIRIGALTTIADIVQSPVINEDYSLLAQAAHSVAGPNIRNMATLGGNLAQDVRCWYYRYPQQIGGPITCLRKGGKACSALLGDNRYHSIFGAAPMPEGRCASNCPAHINIPGYLRLLREGKLAEAAGVLMQYNPLPAITGRVCPVFCEPQCNRGEFDKPVAIHSIERGVGEYILNHAGEYFTPPAAESGKKIAIVGSGPAGLTAAFYLRKSGHQVTVYERLPEPGGMLLYSIPPYRLPKEVVRKYVQALKVMGIHFQIGIQIDSKATAAIQSVSDAVFVAGGTWRSLKLNVPGEEAQGVYPALEYLKRINSGEKLLLGNKVIVIGGGSVAIDAARTARRNGSEEVHLVCLETRSQVSRDRMPALDWEIQEAEEEGILIHPSTGIREITGANGRATGIETMRCTSVRDSNGIFNPQFDDKALSLSLRGESIIVAIGQAADPSPFSTGENVFIGGDMAEGSSTVIQAVASARKSVREIESLLGGAGKVAADEAVRPEYPESRFDDIPRAEARVIPAAERITNIHIEDVADLSAGEIQSEAHRCVSCGCLAVGPSDLAIALVALDASVVTTKRILSAQAFFSATASSSTVLEPDELIKEVRIPKPSKKARQSYVKFTLRKPIDFALVSVATIITAGDDICSDARIVLGAVAPSPVRSTAAEEAVKGKRINEDRAAEAAKLALADVQPLAMNAYKAEIAKVLVKRSILGIPE